jgi:hypothetical protein
LKETHTKLASQINEAKTLYRSKLKESIGTANAFVTRELAKTIKALAESKKNLVAKQKKLDEQFNTVKAEVARQQAERVTKIDEFVVRQVKRELNEFKQDHRALVETRVKIVAESKKKLADTQKKFVSESAKKVEAEINNTLKREMSQLHEDLERNRQNNFGRRVFEAVAAEFMTSYLNEGSEIRALQNVLESKESELAAKTAKLNEAKTAIESVTRKVKLAEDRAIRTKTMTELLSNLRGDKRQMMESLLETTKTDALRSAFDKYLPAVLNEGVRKAPAPQNNAPKVLSETKAPVRRVVTGDKTNRLAESAQIETDNELDVSSEMIAQVVRLAGIQK